MRVLSFWPIGRGEKLGPQYNTKKLVMCYAVHKLVRDLLISLPFPLFFTLPALAPKTLHLPIIGLALWTAIDDGLDCSAVGSKQDNAYLVWGRNNVTVSASSSYHQ